MATKTERAIQAREKRTQKANKERQKPKQDTDGAERSA